MTNTLIHEVEESLRQERLERFWKENGPYLIAGIILAVLITAATAGWRSWNEKVNTAQTATLLDALDREDGQTTALAAARPGLRAGPKALAALSEAGLLLRDGKKDDALALYQATAADTAIDPLFRDLAQFLAVRLAWAEVSETGDGAALLADLAPLWKSKDAPWGWHAHLQAALILAHGTAPDYAAARTHLFAILGGKDVPPSLTERARALDHVYALKAAALPAEDKTATDSKEKPEG